MATEAVVSALQELYKTVLHMAGSPQSTMSFPEPEWQPPRNSTKTEEVLRLMRRLPYCDTQIAPNTSPVNYLHPNWIGNWIPFDAFKRTAESDVNDNELVLTMQEDNFGAILILDVSTGTARLITDTTSEYPCTQHVSERCPRLCRHASNVQGVSAVDVLTGWQKDLIELRSLVEDRSQVVNEETAGPDRFRLMTQVYRQYGWPATYDSAGCGAALNAL